MQETMEGWNTTIVESMGFSLCLGENRYGTMGQCWKLAPEVGEGFFWAYGEKDLFDIKIHDFYFNEDMLIENRIAGYLSIFYYDSISGEQLTPYRQMSPGCIQSLVGNDKPYRIRIHKKIPVRCIGIGISPVYYGNYMKDRYSKEYFDPHTAFAKLNQDEDFPELVFLLKQVENYRGEGIAAKMFYEGKVSEVVSLLIGRMERNSRQMSNRKIDEHDSKQIKVAVDYIDAHYAYDIPLKQLAGFACMGTTKFKVVFKNLYGCTVTNYIQRQRLHHAECLLTQNNLTVGQIAESVGYSTSSRLAKLFRQHTGLLPTEFRKMVKRN
ncbi:MAG: AraC family transcriptional regulator [Spirochaetia bacterium]|jgi:AraC-like DNA-binding protein|nr:AraC family transcriptional regulator [Spirochaetia bacterium]